jgi:hypothetical protein
MMSNQPKVSPFAPILNFEFVKLPLPSFFSNDRSIKLEERDYKNIAGPAGEVLGPIIEKLDNFSEGFLFTYADTGISKKSIPGLLFLSTNAAYGACGILLGLYGNLVAGLIIEVAGVASFCYHYLQLVKGPSNDEVRLALLVDYVFALLAVGYTAVVSLGLIAGGEMWGSAEAVLALQQGVFFGLLGIATLYMGWVYEYGMPYVAWHGLWHIFSALSAYEVGQAQSLILSLPQL